MSDVQQFDASAIFHWIANLTGAGVIIGTLAGFLPAFAAFVALVWYTIEIYESKTFQGFLGRRRQRRLNRLEAKLKRLRGDT